LRFINFVIATKHPNISPYINIEGKLSTTYIESNRFRVKNRLFMFIVEFKRYQLI